METSSDSSSLDTEMLRYSRQTLHEKIGVEGQRRLLESSVVVFGCGALGSVIASTRY